MGRRVLAALIAFVALVLGVSLLAFGQESDPVLEDAAVAAAEEWLALIDEEKHAESWDRSSELLRAAITREGWERQIGGVRGAFGAVVSREVQSRRRETSLPGAPDGDYVVIQFATSFENKAEAVETVTPRLEEGAWRVAGYYIR